MRGGESGRDEVGVRQITRTMLYWCYSIIHPSYHAVTLKGHHPHGAHIDVWACDISRVCMCVCTRAAVWEFPSLHPDEPSTHLCLVLSLPSRLFLSVRPRCDSMFPISERIGTLGGRKKKGERGSKTELPQWSWHLSVLNWRAAVLVGEKHSLPDVIAAHRPGSVSADSHSEAVSLRQFILSEGFTLEGNDFDVYVKKWFSIVKNIHWICNFFVILWHRLQFCGPPQTPGTHALHMDRQNNR